MDLQTRLTEDMKASMKAGNKDRLGVIRMLLNDVKNRDLAGKNITPEQAVEAYGKKLRKSVEEYEKLGKTEETTKLKAELVTVEEYLPKKLSAEETEQLVEQFLSGNSFTSTQMGQAIGMFMKQHGSTIDTGIASAAIRRKLMA